VQYKLDKKWREFYHSLTQTLTHTAPFSLFSNLNFPMNKTNSRKRSAPPPQPPPPTTKQALSQEEEFVDEDVFIDETLLSEDEESAILRDIEQRQALAARLAKWTRPPLSQEYLSQSRSIRE
jgi:hypothetical protein